MRIIKNLFFGVMLFIFVSYFNTSNIYAQECKEYHTDFWNSSITCKAKAAYCPGYDTCTNISDGIKCCKIPPPTPTVRPNCQNEGDRVCGNQGKVCTIGITGAYICVAPTPTAVCASTISYVQAECISCVTARAPYIDCRGNKTGTYQAYASLGCSESSACRPAPFAPEPTSSPTPTTPPAPTAGSAAPTAAPRASTIAGRAPVATAVPRAPGQPGNQNPAVSQDSSDGEESPAEAPAPVVGSAIDDSKCTDVGFALDGGEYGQCGGAIHNTCDEAPDGDADENTELVVKRYKNEDGELRYLTQTRGKTPGVCGNPAPTSPPSRSPTAGGNGENPDSRRSGNDACEIGSQSPSMSDTCAQCIGMAQHVKPNDPDKFNVCSDTQVTNYWCNGGVSEGAKNDCTEAKRNKCATQCAGGARPTAAQQPTNTPVPGEPTATPGGDVGELPADIAALDIAEPKGCIGTSDLSAVDVGIGAGILKKEDHTRLSNYYRSSSKALRKFLCSEIKQNP